MRRNGPLEPEPVRLNPDTYELSEGFMPSPATYHLLLPNRLRMTRLVWSAGRAAPPWTERGPDTAQAAAQRGELLRVRHHHGHHG